MTGDELRPLLDDALRRLSAYVEEFRALDAALGDADLGITVEAGAAAARQALAELPPGAPMDVMLTSLASAIANANPSTFAALTSGGLLAAARTVGATSDLGPTDWIELGRTTAAAIAKRGKSDLGDKTILDALIPSLDAAEAADPGERIAAAVGAARTGIETSTGLISRRGRAAWIGDRSQGLQDPGATVYVRFLESLAEAVRPSSVPPDSRSRTIPSRPQDS
jgi:phosphoenolpyruvate---glycerone phosphotransferase subunit DhaL